MEKHQYSVQNNDEKILALENAYKKFALENDFQNALSVAEELIEIRGQAQDWLNQGFCQITLGLFEEAFKSYTRTLDIDSDNYVAWTNIGALFNSVRKYDTALECLYIAIQLQPEDLDILTNIGISLNNSGRNERALEVLDRLIKLDPNIIEAWSNRGSALYHLERYEEALFSYEKALQLEPSNEETLINRSFLLSSLQRHDEALASYDLALKYHSNSSESWLGRGTVLINIFRFDEALQSIDKSIEINKYNSKAWFAKGFVLNELECYEKALDSLDSSIELGNQNFSVFINRAKALLALNNWDEGCKALDVALKCFSNAEEFDLRITNQIVINLLHRTEDLNLWQSRIKKLLEICDKHSISYVLAEGLIESISRLVSLVYQEQKVKIWRDIWQFLTNNRPEFQTALRLLDTAVKYRETKGNPIIYLGLSREEESIFKSLLGVEDITDRLRESELIFDASYVAQSGYKFLGRGVVCFFGEKPEYIAWNKNMPDTLLALVEDYSPTEEFLVITSNHINVMLIEFADLRHSEKSITEEEYEKELEKLLAQLNQQGIDTKTIDEIRQMILANRREGTEIDLSNYPPEILTIAQSLSAEILRGNLQLIDFYNFFH
jgi:tetratricopeptide (TPR) repeat protein